jgi:hypothetical protein
LSPAYVSDAGEPASLKRFSGKRRAKFPEKLAKSEKRNVKAGLEEK